MVGGACVAVFLRLLCASALGLGLTLPASAQTQALSEPQGEVLLEIHGAIARSNAEGAALLDRAMLEALPRAQFRTHTSVTDGVHHFEGVLMRDLLDHVQAHGSSVRATALNDYFIDFDLDEFRRYDVLAAWSMDGQVLKPSDKGPLWIVYPRDAHRELQDIRYDYRWVWQLVRLDVR